MICFNFISDTSKIMDGTILPSIGSTLVGTTPGRTAVGRQEVNNDSIKERRKPKTISSMSNHYRDWDFDAEDCFAFAGALVTMTLVAVLVFGSDIVTFFKLAVMEIIGVCVFYFIKGIID